MCVAAVKAAQEDIKRLQVAADEIKALKAALAKVQSELDTLQMEHANAVKSHQSEVRRIEEDVQTAGQYDSKAALFQGLGLQCRL